MVDRFIFRSPKPRPDFINEIFYVGCDGIAAAENLEPL
jgi:hypothetical protein